VEGISLPMTDEKLGTRLVKAGCLTEQQLAEELIEESGLTRDEKKLKPLGQRLVERGYATPEIVQEIMERQTRDQVFALAHWRSGVFCYDEPEEMPHFQIAIQSDIHGLLLEAYRRMDEGESSWKARTAMVNEICYACPAIRTCNEQIKARYRKKDLCLWREMSAVLDEESRESRNARTMYRSSEGERVVTLDAFIERD